MDLILEARAFVQGTFQDVEIGIDQSTGMIVAVKKNLSGADRIRHRGKLLIPSGVDWHVHFRDPGAPQKEDFRTGTLGAVLGGVGTVLDMPNTKPVVDRVSRLEEKEDDVRRKSVVDWGLWATVTPQTPDPLGLATKAAGLKLFMAPTTDAEAAPTDELLENALEGARKAGRWVTVHAEAAPKAMKERDNRGHDGARDAAGEVAAIEHLAKLARDPERVHIAHATTQEALEAAAKASFAASSTPHHLLLSYEQRSDAFGKVNPPLRSEERRAALWDQFRAGKVRHLESDHAPHTIDEKKVDYDLAPSGLPGVQTMLPLMLWKAKHGDVPVEEVVKAASERPAADLGLARGRIAPGMRADFFLIDPKTPVEIRADRLATKAQWTPFEGWQALVPQLHYLGGDLVVEEGHFIGKAGRGAQIRPVFHT